MRTGDIVFCPDLKMGVHRFYRIEGVFLGAAGQEGYVELKSLTERQGDGIGPTTFCPEPLLRHFTIYTPDIKETK
jgi:hypothetical protein